MDSLTRWSKINLFRFYNATLFTGLPLTKCSWHEYKVFTTRPEDDGSRVGMPLIAIVLVALFSYFANKNIKHGESNMKSGAQSALVSGLLIVISPAIRR